MFFGNIFEFFVYTEYTEIAFDIATIAFSLSVRATILCSIDVFVLFRIRTNYSFNYEAYDNHTQRDNY